MVSAVTRRTAEIERALQECLATADSDVVLIDGDLFLRVFVPQAHDLGITVPFIPLRSLARELERFLS